MSKICWCVVLAAGESKRFIEAGYATPKPLLQIRSRDGIPNSMLGHVCATIPDHCNTIIALSRFLQKPSNVEGSSFSIGRSIGQADTLFQVVKNLPPDDHVLALDCDTILRREDLQVLIDKLKDHVATVAITENVLDGNMSRVDSNINPQIFVEKQFISHWAVIGARGFHNTGYLTEVLRTYITHCKMTEQEPYLTPAMNLYEGIKYAHVIRSLDWQ